MANGYTHAALESIPGNETNAPTLSTKVIYEPIQSLEIQLGPQHMERDDELRNVDEPLALLAEHFDPTWSLTSRAYPDMLGFELSAMLGLPTSTKGNGTITDPDGGTIPSGTIYRHVWTAPFGPSGLSPKTAQRQVAYSDESFFLKAKGCGTDTLSIDSPDSGGVSLKTSGPALYVAKIADPSLTPAYETLSIPPFERSHLTLPTWLSGTGETEDFTVAISNPMDRVRTLGIASKFADQLEKGDGPIVVSGSIPKRVIDPDDWDALVAATGFAVKAKWISTVNVGAVSYKYSLWMECLNVQYTDGGPEALANKRRLGGSFNWKSTYNGTAGSTKFTLVNGTSSYA